MVDERGRIQQHLSADQASVRRLLLELRDSGMRPLEAAGFLAAALSELVMHLKDDGTHVPQVAMTIQDKAGNPREFVVSIREAE